MFSRKSNSLKKFIKLLDQSQLFKKEKGKDILNGLRYCLLTQQNDIQLLNKGVEVHRKLFQASQNVDTEKNDKQIEWYKRMKDSFYSKQKLPNDEEIQQFFLQFLEEQAAAKFIDALCFSSLEDTTNVITIVMKQIHDKLNEMYSEQIKQDLILYDEQEKNVKKKKNQVSGAGLLKKKKASIKQKKKGINPQIGNIKEPSFAEEVSLLHQKEIMEEKQQLVKPGDDKLIKSTTNMENSIKLKEKSTEKVQNKKKQIGSKNNQTLLSSKSNEVQVSQITIATLSAESKEKQEQNKDQINQIENIQNRTEEISQKSPLIQSKKNEILEMCCNQNKCEMLEISKEIASRLISACIQNIEKGRFKNTCEIEVSNTEQEKKPKKKRAKGKKDQQSNIIEQDEDHLSQIKQINSNVYSIKSCCEDTDELGAGKDVEAESSDDNNKRDIHSDNTTIDCACERMAEKNRSRNSLAGKDVPASTVAGFSDEEDVHQKVEKMTDLSKSDRKYDLLFTKIKVKDQNKRDHLPDIQGSSLKRESSLSLSSRSSFSIQKGQPSSNKQEDDEFIQVAAKKKKEKVEKSKANNQNKGRINGKNNNNNSANNNNNNHNNNNTNNNNNKNAADQNDNLNKTNKNPLNKPVKVNDNSKKINSNNNSQSNQTEGSKNQKNVNTNSAKICNKTAQEAKQFIESEQKNQGKVDQNKISTKSILPTHSNQMEIQAQSNNQQKQPSQSQNQNQEISSLNQGKSTVQPKKDTTKASKREITKGLAQSKKNHLDQQFPPINTIDFKEDIIQSSQNNSSTKNDQSSTIKQSTVLNPSVIEKKQIICSEIKVESVLISLDEQQNKNNNLQKSFENIQSPNTPQLLQANQQEKNQEKITPPKQFKKKLIKSPIPKQIDQIFMSDANLKSNSPFNQNSSENFTISSFNEPSQISMKLNSESNQEPSFQIPQQQIPSSESPDLLSGVKLQKTMSVGNNVQISSGKKKQENTQGIEKKQQVKGNVINQWKEDNSQTHQQGPTQSQINKTRVKVAKKIFKKKISHDILSFTEYVNAESFKIQPSRFLAIFRIQHILKKLYENIEQADLRIFGSCATGLSLPTSDIDLSVVGFEYSPRKDLIQVLNNLANVLEKFKWIKSLERIFTANIPILKIELDPLTAFKECTNYEEMVQFLEGDHTALNLKEGEEGPKLYDNNILKVDITVECQQSQGSEILSHMGFLSTDFVIRWMSYYSRLLPIAIIMKCFLQARSLNTNFKGGISSYCLLILIIAYFRDNQNISQSEDYSHILQSFLKYYGTQFNPENTGVSLMNGNPFFQTIQNPSYSKLQVVDPLTGKVMTQNTYLIDEILKEIQGFYVRLLEYGKKVEKSLEKLSYEQIEKIDKADLSDQTPELSEILSINQIQLIISNIDSTKLEDKNLHSSNALPELSLLQTVSAPTGTSKRHKNHQNSAKGHSKQEKTAADQIPLLNNTIHTSSSSSCLDSDCVAASIIPQQ